MASAATPLKTKTSRNTELSLQTAIPERTNIPAPMIAPILNMVALNNPNNRCSLSLSQRL